MGSRWLLLTALLVGCTSHAEDDRESLRQQCAQLSEHLIDLRLASVDGAAAVDVAQHRQALRAAVGDTFAASCEHAMNSQQIKCGLAAKDASAANACWSN